MPLFVAGLVLVGLLALTNLVLTFGVIRRLRVHSEAISAAAGPPARSAIGIDVGSSPAAFQATATDGRQVGAGSTGPEPTVVAFFSPRCPACRDRLPGFGDYVARQRLGRDSVLAVVVGDEAADSDFVAALSPLALVVTEPDGGAVSAAFQIAGFPAFCVLDGQGRVVAAEHDPDHLPLALGV